MTKTDITRYIRCPSAIWVLYKGMLSFAESITPLQAWLIERGVAFQDQVEAQAEPLVEDVDLPTLFARSDLTIYGLPLLVNKELGFAACLTACTRKAAPTEGRRCGWWPLRSVERVASRRRGLETQRRAVRAWRRAGRERLGTAVE